MGKAQPTEVSKSMEFLKEVNKEEKTSLAGSRNVGLRKRNLLLYSPREDYVQEIN